MPLTSRILDPGEWPRLVGTESEKIWPLLDPANACVLVVEDEGKIVGTWTLMRTVHAECLWVDPKYRGRFGVTKRLLAGMKAIAKAWGAKVVITASVTAHVTDLIRRIGGVAIPYEMFAVPVEAQTQEERCHSRPL